MSFTAKLTVINQPIGLLGGTFDPVHTAHLRLAEEALRQLGLAEVLWIPAGQPHHRAAPLAAPEHRLAMVSLATAGHPRFRVDDAEILNATPGYTVPMLERLRRDLGDRRPLVLLMGADAFLMLTGWHRWRELFRLAHIGIASRPTFPLTPAAMPAELAEEFQRRHGPPAALTQTAAGVIVDFPLSAGTVSATEVRAKLRQGTAADTLLPAPVLDYIHRHHLYSN
ncbi:MAG: nicotinate-nucleotide adenylyltransferase [Zoogloeaceae bacterium]|jgi:nicotinate-nucleotide adenylyltransferase|nr:nicotinate-nucleotide adenylyltransferase [Zoogloeaceae bacterium]